MISKVIKFKDFKGVERTEEHFFHFTQAELLEMQMSEQGGFDAMIKRLIAAQDQPGIMAAVKDIIRKSYGRISPDGRKFEKSEAIWKDFEQTEAFSKLFVELYTDSDKAADFVNGLIPEGLPKPTQAQIEEAAGLRPVE